MPSCCGRSSSERPRLRGSWLGSLMTAGCDDALPQTPSHPYERSSFRGRWGSGTKFTNCTCASSRSPLRGRWGSFQPLPCALRAQAEIAPYPRARNGGIFTSRFDQLGSCSRVRRMISASLIPTITLGWSRWRMSFSKRGVVDPLHVAVEMSPCQRAAARTGSNRSGVGGRSG
jgi:hypothetical protein